MTADDTTHDIRPSNESILGEAVAFVNEGIAVTLLVKGRSMLPFIQGGRDSVVLVKPGDISPGDVVLARIGGVRYVLHRVIESTPGKVVLMGDGNIRGTETCRPQDVLARAVEVVKPDGSHRSLISPAHMRRARLWRRLLPIRRWILAIYKRTIIRNIEIQ
ncbi:MAG: S24/S26 family peptidase [Bacteroidales bacterium]|nr:S24/S26 family peptidase [Bacteroidales bacterium]